MYNFLTHNRLCNFHNWLHSFLWRQQFPKQYTKREILLMSCACRSSNSANHHNLRKNYLSLSSARQLKFEYHNSKPPRPIIMITNRKQGQTVRSHLLHSSLAYAQLCCTFYQPQRTIKICRNKTIFLSQTQTLPHGPITMTRQSNPNHTSFLTLLKSNIILCIFSTPNSPASAAAAGPTLKQNYDSPFNLPQFSYMSQ